MSVLARYKKPGGFRQLIVLIETSQPVKQAKLIEVIENEDPHWAELIRQKKLSAEIVLAFEDQHLATIFEYMRPKLCATLLKSLGDNRIKDFHNFLPFEKYKAIKEHLDGMDMPKPVEVVAAQNHLIETVRYLDEEKKLELRYIAPQLDISEAA